MEYCYNCNCGRGCCPRCHCCRCCCCCLVSASFTAVKRDSVTGIPLPGAVYTLYQGDQAIAATVSDACGALTFSGLAQGQYELVETIAPLEYQQDSARHVVDVDALGKVTIDGQDGQCYALYNIPRSLLSFRKIDAGTGLPLAGAEFTLSNGQIAASDDEGTVNLSALAPGTYTMRETTAPTGYLTNSAEYQVQVAANGDITINGTPSLDFSVSNTRAISPPPTANAIVESEAL